MGRGASISLHQQHLARFLGANDKQEGWKQGTSSKRDKIDLKRQKHDLTVGTTVVPNLANSGNVVGKPIPVSQTVAPPVMDPDSGFTCVSMGAISLSVPVVGISWPRGITSPSDLGLVLSLQCS